MIAVERFGIANGAQMNDSRAHDRQLRPPAAFNNGEHDCLHVVAMTGVAQRTQIAIPRSTARPARHGDVVTVADSAEVLGLSAFRARDLSWHIATLAV